MSSGLVDRRPVGRPAPRPHRRRVRRDRRRRLRCSPSPPEPRTSTPTSGSPCSDGSCIGPPGSASRTSSASACSRRSAWHESAWLQPEHDRLDATAAMARRRWLDEIPTLADGLLAPMGGIWTTVADMARWVDLARRCIPGTRRGRRRTVVAARRDARCRPCNGAPARARCAAYVTDRLRLRRSASSTSRISARWSRTPAGCPATARPCDGSPAVALGASRSSNVTYAPMTELAARILDAVARAGRDRRAATRSRHRCPWSPTGSSSLLNDWSDTTADALFTASFDRRRSARTPSCGGPTTGRGGPEHSRVVGIDADAGRQGHDPLPRRRRAQRDRLGDDRPAASGTDPVVLRRSSRPTTGPAR